MTTHYEEILEGESVIRQPPGVRHERVLNRLRELLQVVVNDVPSIELLKSRSVMQISPGSMLRPDMCVVSDSGRKLELAIEVIDSYDHRIDTVQKKDLYDSYKVPRLWIIDPRYDNIEVYHRSEFGMRLNEILAGQDSLEDEWLPGFRVVAKELFAE